MWLSHATHSRVLADANGLKGNNGDDNDDDDEGSVSEDGGARRDDAANPSCTPSSLWGELVPRSIYFWTYKYRFATRRYVTPPNPDYSVHTGYTSGGAVRMSLTEKGNGTKAGRRWAPRMIEGYSFASERQWEISSDMRACDARGYYHTMNMFGIFGRWSVWRTWCGHTCDADEGVETLFLYGDFWNCVRY